MDRNFRRETIRKLAGLVSDMVEKSFENPPKKFQSLGSVGVGTTVMSPENPVKSDGSVDIVIQIRGIAGGDVKTVGGMGLNAVIVTAERGGLGSKPNAEAYGNANFVNEAVAKVLSFLRAKFPEKNVHLGKLTVSSFSGGGDATAAILSQRNQLPKGTQPPKFIFIDGLHANPKGAAFKAVADYANEVSNDPSKGELAIVHTAILPGGYASTTEVADGLLNAVGLQRKKLDKTNPDEVGPVSEAQRGGFKVIQLYDQQQPYMAKDEHGQLKPNVKNTSGYQHIQALNWGLRNVLK